MDEDKQQVILHTMLACIMIMYAIRKMFFEMFSVAAYNTKYIHDRSYTLDFHKKRRRLREMVYGSDITYFNQTRMYRATFFRLCSMLETISGLKPTRHMLVDEQVAIFLHVLAHHVKNRVIQFEFGRSGETISRYFKIVLKVVVRLQGELFKTPESILEDSVDERWKWFKGCLGALDETHIRIQVPAEIKGRYRNRKGDITTNVLGVCSQNGEFIFIFPRWEGSATDSRVMRDAIARPNGFKVSQENYYLVDAGYTNCEGFLAPYRGQ